MSDPEPLTKMPAFGDWVWVADRGTPYRVQMLDRANGLVCLETAGWKRLGELYCIQISELHALRVRRDTLTHVIDWLRRGKRR